MINIIEGYEMKMPWYQHTSYGLWYQHLDIYKNFGIDNFPIDDAIFHIIINMINYYNANKYSLFNCKSLILPYQDSNKIKTCSRQFKTFKNTRHDQQLRSHSPSYRTLFSRKDDCIKKHSKYLLKVIQNFDKSF
jgi:hypothetical protein